MSLFRSRVIAGRYELRAPLGEGTFSSTWRATDNVLGRDVAIKVLREQYSNHPTFAARFDYEARAAALVSHPNVVHMYDVGETQGRLYLAMEYGVGTTLRALVKTEVPLARKIRDEAVYFRNDWRPSATLDGSVASSTNPSSAYLMAGAMSFS